MITGRDPETGQTVRVEVDAGRIAAIEPVAATGDAYLAPGLIDLQVNGYMGCDLNRGSITVGDVSALAAALRTCAVTTFLPTLITAPRDSLLQALATIAEARRGDPLLARSIPYVHVEGPWLSDQDGPRGAHPVEHVRAPDLAEFHAWQDACDGLVGMVTLSPHHDNSDAVIRELTDTGVHVALGHTHASPEQIVAAVDAGARLSTHLGNGAAALLPRHPNYIWTQLAEDRLTATFIADGHHLSGDPLKAMVRAKGLERSILVSDSVALGGLPPGQYDQPIGGRLELGADGRLGIVGTPYLAGAALPLKDGIARAVALAGLSLADAVRLATVNPGRFVGGRGRLEVGGDADLVRFRWQPGDTRLEAETIMVAGEIQ